MIRLKQIEIKNIIEENIYPVEERVGIFDESVITVEGIDDAAEIIVEKINSSILNLQDLEDMADRFLQRLIDNKFNLNSNEQQRMKNAYIESLIQELDLR